MACFLAPVAEAVVVSIVKHHVEKKEKADASGDKERHGIPFATKLGWLTKLLWGAPFCSLWNTSGTTRSFYGLPF